MILEYIAMGIIVIIGIVFIIATISQFRSRNVGGLVSLPDDPKTFGAKYDYKKNKFIEEE